jgi:hypothetical protein
VAVNQALYGYRRNLLFDFFPLAPVLCSLAPRKCQVHILDSLVDA